MNFWKKSSVKQELYKEDHENGTAKVPLKLAWTGVILFILGVFVIGARNYIPKYYARFYLTRSVLHTRERLLDLWGEDGGKAGEARESFLKLKAEEARWNGHSILVLPGGLGVSWRHMKNEENTFAQGSLDVYFLGTVREGLDYWADEEYVLLQLPGAGGLSVKTSQDTLKKVTGFSVIPEKGNGPEDKIEILKKAAIDMMNRSELRFAGRDEGGVKLIARIPAPLFDQYLETVGNLLEEGASGDIKKWGQLLRERKTEGEAQEVLFAIDKKRNINSVAVEGLADASLVLKADDSASIKGRIGIGNREAGLEAVVYSGGGPKGRRAFQIPELNILYKKENISLDLKLSGGYEDGSIEKEKLEFSKLSSGEEEWGNERLQKEKEEFLKKARQLGFDFGK
ncbi:hypothetical protein [Lacrimispora sp.]|uniref:hypothetical protein n=1 Tax=Lacrimispora sp. TaxID=2719234 RepID=UPI0034614436